MGDKQVAIIMGSDSDYPVIEKALDLLDEFGIGWEVRVMSAHRTPELVDDFVSSAAGEGYKVIIAVAGLAAHLGGVAAAKTHLPVIGVPAGGGPLDGMDALLATVQMPPGIPVATVAIGKTGGYNAAVLAARIIALFDEGVRGKLAAFIAKMKEKVAAKDKALQEKIAGR